jgi:phosphonate transport system ATP-binding protein
MEQGTTAHAIRVAGLTKTYGKRKALDDVHLSIEPGEMVALIGASGSGKSTLLRHVAGLVVSDSGSCCVEVLGGPLQRNGRLDRNIRNTRTRLGFIFQQFNLVGRLPVITNVLTGTLGRLPQWRSLLGLFNRAERQLAVDALTRVGIAETAWQRASTLSGGQQQRAAIARTLVQQASIILADEPIASLDPESSRRVMETLARINAEDRTTVVVSLHQVDFAVRYCPRTVALKQGRVVYDGPSAALNHQLLRELYGTEAAELEADTTQAFPSSAAYITRSPAATALAQAMA